MVQKTVEQDVDHTAQVIAEARRVRGNIPWAMWTLKTRPTREGLQILFLTLFVLVGAILRDINLLIMLAGIMVGMFFLQWRLCFRTLVGLRIRRNVAESMQARSTFPVEVSIRNARKWLPAWMVVVRDRIQQIEGDDDKTNRSISLVFPKIALGTEVTSSYSCRFDRRGIYEIGPAEVTTVFPIALLKTSGTASIVDRCIVHPAQGQILPAWRELFESRRFGADKARIQSGSTEGEFYGLRAYQVGDSPRWVHWRSSAKQAELVVRQFERQDNIQASLLLDLFSHDQSTRSQKKSDLSQVEELAIEFVASMANLLVGRGKGVLSVAIAGRSNYTALRIQSRNQVLGLLDQLSVVQSSPTPNWEAALESLATPLRSSPILLVVSTRSEQWRYRNPLASKSQDLVFQRASIRWLDASSSDLDRYFRRAP